VKNGLNQQPNRLTGEKLRCIGGKISKPRLIHYTGELFTAWIEINYDMGKDPDSHGAAEHLLYVGRKNS